MGESGEEKGYHFTCELLRPGVLVTVSPSHVKRDANHHHQPTNRKSTEGWEKGTRKNVVMRPSTGTRSRLVPAGGRHLPRHDKKKLYSIYIILYYIDIK